VFRGIQHCTLVVSDLGRSRDFYRALGLDEVPRPANFTFAGTWFRAGADEIHLIAERETTTRAGGHDPGPGLATGLVTHVAIEVEDLGAMLERVQHRGLETAGGPMPRGDGVDQVFLRDPDGYVVELFQRTSADQSDAPERAAFERPSAAVRQRAR
jgi:catechol 2,3-dioxygenase-like lactoylglutathione lyase family enzyme